MFIALRINRKGFIMFLSYCQIWVQEVQKVQWVLIRPIRPIRLIRLIRGHITKPHQYSGAWRALL